MLELTEVFAARDAEAESVRGRIDADLDRALPGTRRALCYLRDHLFDPELTVARLKRATRNENGELFAAFRHATGKTPKEYIELLRMRIATVLLRNEAFKVDDVGFAVGYARPMTFRVRFKALFALPPGQYRNQHRQGQGTDVDGLDSADGLEAQHWQRVFTHWSAAERVERAAGPTSAVDLARLGARHAETVWEVARGLSPAGRRQMVVNIGRTTPALAELLFERGRVEGRGDRQWGVEVAKLALAAVPPHTNDAWPEARFHEVRVRAHAWLGNAYRLLLEFHASEAAFADARRAIEIAGDGISPLALAESARLEAALGWFRSQYDRALARANEAIKIASAADLLPSRLASLRLRAAVQDSAGRTRESIRDLEACLKLLGPDVPAAEALPIQHALAEGFLALQDPEEAEKALAAADGLRPRAQDDRIAGHFALSHGRLAWLQGDHARARCLIEQALSSFEAQGARFNIVAAMTDLCMVKLESGALAAAVGDAHRLLPALRLLGADAQWDALLRRLGACIARGKLERALLVKIRQALPTFVAHAASGQL